MIDITYGAPPSEKTAVALGYFDGLHLGHMGVIGAALAQRELKPAVFTFNCDTTLPKFRSPEDIISFENKRELLEKMGVEYLCAPDFAEVCTLTDEDFVAELLHKRLNAGFACCGRNFRFGLGGFGTPEKLGEIGKRYGIAVRIVEDVCLDGEMISSTHIRELIRRGELEQANRLLGYELMFKLPVVGGNKLARTMSFPTINQIIPKTNVIPRFGVYASYVSVHGKNHRGITNIGIRPTVADRGDTVMETHILNFSGELYGESVAVSLERFLRPERKFAGLDELKEQIVRDIAAINQ
ncbi:MAG: riboflavin biosynthesis protein RibF [Lachnospiraceae bacterium]|nr:riboflavin biosynthesis protein RibF [Ruminococcus sp.]MCM1275330.1 riboflavin biosynthesis protein RibF [Lachnospiraceae bacterium]